MSFDELLQELPALTAEQRQIVIARALELEDYPFTPEEDAIIEQRMAAHCADPSSAVPVDEMIIRLRDRFSK